MTIQSLTKACIRLSNITTIALGVCTSLMLTQWAGAAPGDNITTVPIPASQTGVGVSVAVDCNGVVYFTGGALTTLHSMDKTGVALGDLPIVDSVTGGAIAIDEMAWDGSRSLLWGGQHGSNPVKVYQIDPVTGVATFQWTSATISVGSYRDGLAYDGTDDTIWISGDVSTTIEHYTSAGASLGAITPKNSVGGILGEISGVTVGTGDLLYLGQDGAVRIVQVKKSNGDFISSFASPGGARDEGLECDPVNFAPKLALWSRDFSGNFFSVIEIEPGSCACGGGGTNVPCTITCPDNITVCNDAGQCGAVVNYPAPVLSGGCSNAVVACDPPSGSSFPKGTTTVTCTAGGSTCSFTVTVNDCEAPRVACRPAENPSGKKIPVAGKNPRSGHNPDGFYQLLARDNCDPIASLQIYVKDSAEGPCGGAFAAGPYAVGTIVKLTQSPGHAGVQPMAGVVTAHVHTRGEPVLVVTDSSGNTTCHRCFVPPPPK